MLTSSKYKLILLSIVLLYLFTRFININLFPIFTDEAIYTYWAKVALNDSANRFISLEDGKQPLFIWVAAVFQGFIKEPLFATRLVSTFSGLGSTIGLYLLAKEIFSTMPTSKREIIALLSSFLYVILPFPLLYDRLALYDSSLAMLGIFSVLFTVKMAKKPKLDTAMLNGFAIGLAMINKSSGNFFLYLLPFSLLLANFKKSKTAQKFFKWTIFSLVTFLITQIMYNSLRLSPLFYIIERKNLEFIRSINEVLNDPFQFAFSNLKAITEWLALYTSYPLFMFFILGLIYGYFKKDFRIVFLSLLILVPFSAEIIFNKILYPRFTFFYYPYVILIIAYAVTSTFNTFKRYSKQQGLLLLLFLILPLTTSFKLLTNPANAGIPETDSNQYFNDWPAGYGVREVVRFLEKESQSEIIYVGTQGTFGIFPHALSVYLWENERIKILPYWPVDPENLPEQVHEFAKNNKTFFIFNENQKPIANQKLRLIEKYQKGKSQSYMRLYEVLPIQ